VMVSTLFLLGFFANYSHGFTFNPMESKSRAKFQPCRGRGVGSNNEFLFSCPLIKQAHFQRKFAFSYMSLSSDDINRDDDLESCPLASDENVAPETNSSNSLEQLPLTLLWAQLDIRNISYDPSATRSELEALLALSNQERSSGEAGSELSLQALLAKLDARSIRYPPSASRRELEQLLLQSRDNGSAQSLKHPGPQSNTKKVSQTSFAEQKLSLRQLLSELDARGVRYSPSASRKELESILRNPSTTRRRETMDNENSTVRDKVPLRKILAELNAKNIRYAPSASRQELERLLRQNSRGATAKERRGISDSPSQYDDDALVDDPFLEDDGSNPATATPPGKRRILSLQTILNELDRRQIRYAPSASRDELENLLRESNHHIRSRRRRRQQHQHKQATSSLKDRLVRQSLPLPARRTIESLRPGLSKVASKAIRQAKYWKRSLADYLAVDEEGVREAEWFYESKAEPIDVKAVPMRQRPKAESTKSRSKVRRNKSSPQRNVVQNVKKTIITPPGRRKNLITSPYLLPPAKTEALQEPVKETPDSPKHEGVQNKNHRRRVYNPYGTARVADTRDVFDRFGDAVADAAETVIWGPLEGDNDGKDDNSGPSRRSKKRASKARYWKDRMEEQVDHFLGIHDNESEYNNWEKEVGAERKHFDTPKKSMTSESPQQRKKSKKVPIWEEEGSLVSLLFGRRPSGGQLKLERFFEQEVGTTLLTNMISSVVKGGLLVASYLCRWASVKGAIPQPVVVMAVASMFASARPGQRVRMIVFTLLVLRTLGELVHGYVQGDQDWEDSNTYEFAKDGPATGDNPDVSNQA
jgi:hypothetical protein